MAKVPGVNGNTYGVEIELNGETYVKINNETITTNRKEVNLFLQAYKMGRDHKKTEIRNALNI